MPVRYVPFDPTLPPLVLQFLSFISYADSSKRSWERQCLVFYYAPPRHVFLKLLNCYGMYVTFSFWTWEHCIKNFACLLQAFFFFLIVFILACVVSENRLQHACILLDLSLFLFGSGRLSRFGGCPVFVGDSQTWGSPVSSAPVQSTQPCIKTQKTSQVALWTGCLAKAAISLLSCKSDTSTV